MLNELLAAQHECVGVWQLIEAGWRRGEIRWRLRREGLRRVSGISGVWTSVRGKLTEAQRWSAATLTAPRTGLTLVSGARHWGVMSSWRPERFVSVVRHGNGGHRRHGDVLVLRRPEPEFVVVRGIPVQPAADILVGLVPHLSDDELRRAVIEGIRLRLVTVGHLREVMGSRRGAPRMRALLDSLDGLPIAGTKSNAEGQALYRLKNAGRKIPESNQIVAGHEADLVDYESREITEIDGPAFHADLELDEQKDRDRRAAGFTVRRRPSRDAYDPDAEW